MNSSSAVPVYNHLKNRCTPAGPGRWASNMKCMAVWRRRRPGRGHTLYTCTPGRCAARSCSDDRYSAALLHAARAVIVISLIDCAREGPGCLACPAAAPRGLSSCVAVIRRTALNSLSDKPLSLWVKCSHVVMSRMQQWCSPRDHGLGLEAPRGQK